MDYMEEASRHYLKGDYAKAIPPYKKALDLEKQDRKLARSGSCLSSAATGDEFGIVDS